MEQKNDRPWVDFIVTHFDEPWEVGKKFFDMLAMQRCIDFSRIHVILVHDDKETASQWDWHELLKSYPFRTAVISIEHAGPAAARNAGLSMSRADWVMFCDFDDMFADIVAVRGILQVLPTDDADVIWMKSYREEVARATNIDKNGVFVNCLDENFYHTFGKMYRRKELRKHNLQFNQDLFYEYESAFNHLALTVIPSHRVMGLTVDFLPYMKTLRMDSWKMRKSTLQLRLCETISRDIYLAEEYKRRGYTREFRNMVAETIHDSYFILLSEPLLEKEYAYAVSERFRQFVNQYRDVFDNLSAVENEVVLDNCINKMLGMVQILYNYHSIEIMPPLTDHRNIVSWLNDFMGSTPAAQPVAQVPAPEPAHAPVLQQSDSAGKKVVIYCGTYNTYPNMIVSAKSLLAHTPIDKIYFLTEDDVFPYEIPDIIENINVKSQRYFPEGGPNFDNVWSYMCMMRAAFPQMFPQHDKALSLDIDIIVNEDISALWDLDLTDYYYAGVPEPCRQKTSTDPIYCNFGVIMMNLDKLRRDGKDQEAIDLLNRTKLGCPEQDAFNRVCAHHILPLSPNYNFTPFSHITGEPDNEIITHYAGLKYWKHFEPVRKYGNMTWQQVMDSGKNNVIMPAADTVPVQKTKEASDMPRIAFMFGTRDWYHRMALSLKSLLKYTYLDKVYFMIEDDFFPEPLPPLVQCVNVSNQEYFQADGPNYQSIYSYMVLLRAALPLMFPDIDLALCIDADTLTRGDIGGIWDTDMSDNYLAAVKELRALHGADYYNCGVMLMNFANLRRDNVPEQAIKRLNETYYRWKEQDVLNDMCRYHIAELPAKYNHAHGITSKFDDPYIVRHYIGGPGAKKMMMNDAEQFEQMSWNEIVTERGDNP